LTGRLYDRLDISGKAIETYREAIDLDPAYYESYEELGLFFYYRGKDPEAAENFRKAIARAPGIADGYTSLGGVMTDQGGDMEAEQVLLESLKLRKTAPALNN